MRIYRVVLKVSYCDTYFDFTNIVDAGNFAEQILTHQVASEDTEKAPSVKIIVIGENDDNMEE